MPKKTWLADESIRVKVNSPNALTEEPENRKVLDACHQRFGEVRMRLNLGAYGPGTTDKPSSRYWWMIGENATVVCRDPEIANWFREQLKEWVRGMDGVVLEVSDGQTS